MNKTYLSHHGIKGQRWGVRRYQNEDGTLTPRGEQRYGTVENMNETRSRNRKRMIGIGVGVGVTAAVAGGVVLARKNKRLKEELGGYKAKEAKMLSNLEKGRAKRLANIAAGITSPNYKIPKGANVTVSYSSKTKKTTEFISESLKNVGGGIIKKGGK